MNISCSAMLELSKRAAPSCLALLDHRPENLGVIGAHGMQFDQRFALHGRCRATQQHLDAFPDAALEGAAS